MKPSRGVSIAEPPDDLPDIKLGGGSGKKDDAKLKRTFAERHKPRLKETSYLKVRVRDPQQPSESRIVEVANLPQDGMSEWLLRELSGCHPEYQFRTPESEPIPVSWITHIQRGKSTEQSFEPVCTAEKTGPFRPLCVHLRIGRGERVGIANIPDSETGRQIVQRLMSTDAAHARALYHEGDFLTTDFGWMPIRKIDPTAFSPQTP